MQLTMVDPRNPERFPKPRSKPRTYTTNEQIVERLSEEIMCSGHTMKSIARDCGLHPSTIYAIGCGKTKWPKPTTLFALLGRFNLELQIVHVRR